MTLTNNTHVKTKYAESINMSKQFMYNILYILDFILNIIRTHNRQ